MRRTNLAIGEYYHIYNRGVEKRAIFLDSSDYWRFMAALIGFQGDADLNPVNRFVRLVKQREFNAEIFKEIAGKKYTELNGFCLMPNHFHLMLHEIAEGGISKFMQRSLNSYTKYFNAKYDRSGHLFSGRVQSSHINRDEYLRYLSAYIHLNPNEIKKWAGRAIEYPWSSFRDCVIENRWAGFLRPEIYIDQVGGMKEYSDFIKETSITKVERKLESVEHPMFNMFNT